MAQKIFDRYKVIDTDTHITEPGDVWTSRVSSKWGNKVPHIQRIDGRDFDAAVLQFLDDDIARQQGADLRFRQQGLVGKGRITGTQNPVVTKIDIQLLFSSYLGL